MSRILIGWILLLLSLNVTGSNTPKITTWEEVFKLLEGFNNIAVITFVNDQAKSCFVQEKALLTKALLAVGKASINIEEDGTKAHAILVIGVETETPNKGYCLSKVSIELSALADNYFEKANLQKAAMVTLFEDDRLIYTTSLDHSKPVESATKELLDVFTYKWKYFNQTSKDIPK